MKMKLNKDWFEKRIDREENLEVGARNPSTDEITRKASGPHDPSFGQGTTQDSSEIVVGTGAVCPESGVWKVQGFPSTTAPIAEGNRMPPYLNKAVNWVLVQCD